MLKRLLLVLFAMAISVTSARAQVTINALGNTTECEGTSPVTCSPFSGAGGIAAGSNIVLVVVTGTGATNNLPSAVTWNGVTVGAAVICTASSNTENVCVYCKAGPATGNNSLVVTDAGAEVHANAIAFNGGNQTTPCKNGAAATDVTGITGTVSVTSVSGDYVMAGQVNGYIGTTSTNHSQLSISGTAPNITLSVNYSTGTGSAIAMTANGDGATSGIWDSAGVDVAAAAGGAACQPNRALRGVGC